MNPWLILGFLGLGLALPVNAQRPPEITVILPESDVQQPPVGVAQPPVPVPQPPTVNAQPNVSFGQPSTSIPSPAPTPSLAPSATPFNNFNTGAGNTLIYPPSYPQSGIVPSLPPSGVAPGVPLSGSTPTMPGSPTVIPGPSQTQGTVNPSLPTMPPGSVSR